jgi:hypothetical protein
MGECINVYNRIVVSCIEVIFACVSMYVCYESEEEIINSIFLRSSFSKQRIQFEKSLSIPISSAPYVAVAFEISYT